MNSTEFPRASLFARSLFLQTGFSDERLQALGFAWAIDPALARSYAGDARGLAEARARHLQPFNTQPHAIGLPLGIAASLEARVASGDASSAARLVSLKSAVGAALAGSADAFFWGALRPFSGALAVFSTAAAWRLGMRHPFADGAVLGLLGFNVPALTLRWIGLRRGLSDGEAAAVVVSRLPAAAWTSALRRAAVVLIFAAGWIALEFPLPESRTAAAAAFAFGAALGRLAGGPWRLVAAAGILGALSAAAGWGS